METLDHLEGERGQSKPPKRAARAKMLRRALKILLIVGPWLARIVQFWFEMKRMGSCRPCIVI